MLRIYHQPKLSVLRRLKPRLDGMNGWGYASGETVSFRYMQLLFPVVVALHNAEEVLRMPRWSGRPGPWFGGVAPAVFRFATITLAAIALLVTVLSVVAGAGSLWAGITFGFMVALLLNVFVPHVAVSIAQRTWMPGAITAVTLNLPVLGFLVVLALQQGYVSRHEAIIFSVVVPLVLLAFLPVLFATGKRFLQ